MSLARHDAITWPGSCGTKNGESKNEKQHKRKGLDSKTSAPSTDLVVEKLALVAQRNDKGVLLLCAEANQVPAVVAAVVALWWTG